MTFETIKLAIMAVSAASWTGRARRARAGDVPFKWRVDAWTYLGRLRAETLASAAFCALWALWHVVGLAWAALDGDKRARAATVEAWTPVRAGAWIVLAVLWIALRRRFDAESAGGV